MGDYQETEEQENDLITIYRVVCPGCESDTAEDNGQRIYCRDCGHEFQQQNDGLRGDGD